jgi:hypothetical protein
LRVFGATATVVVALTLLGAISALAGCGGGGERQDADEPSGKFPIDVTEAKFPNRQRLAEATNLELTIRNSGDRQVPDLAATIFLDEGGADGSFAIRSDQPGLANPNRPVWILEQGYPKLAPPGADQKELDAAPSAGADVAQSNTFAFGPMAPGDTKDIVWHVTPVMGGTYTVNYEISAGLNGKAKAVTADGGPVKGSFVVTISTKPPRTRVNDQGQVVTQK